MTKAKMIETIQLHVSRAWLKPSEYDCKNAPDNGMYADEIAWDTNDKKHRELLNVWCSLLDVLEDMGMDVDYDLTPEISENYENARNFSHELFIRREASRGIFYN